MIRYLKILAVVLVCGISISPPLVSANSHLRKESFRESTADAAQGFSPANISDTAKELIGLLDGRREKILGRGMQPIFPLFLDAGLRAEINLSESRLDIEENFFASLGKLKQTGGISQLDGDKEDKFYTFWFHNVVELMSKVDSFNANVVKKFNDKKKIESFRKLMKVKEHKEITDLFFKWIHLNREEILKYFPPLNPSEKATQLKRLKEYENKFRNPIVSAVREYMERAAIAPEGFEKPAIDCVSSI